MEDTTTKAAMETASAMGDNKLEYSPEISKHNIPTSLTIVKRKTNMSLRSVWCGCFTPRQEVRSGLETPIKSVDSKLLPSSVVQCILKPDVERYNSGANADCESSGRRNTVELPSSVLLTNSLLSSVNHDAPEKMRYAKEENVHGSVWRGFRLRLSKLYKFREPQRSASRQEITDGLSDSLPCATAEGQDDSSINEALVFSPLPSQTVPEMPTVVHHTALLGPRSDSDKGKKCFVIDLDETLVHSSFKVVEHADFKVGVEIDGITHRVYVLKRPHVDTFLSTMSNLYECVLFTASLAKYADPVADFLDKWNTFRYRLFRESCVYHRGNYVKDLSHLGRPINQVVILDNSPASYMFHASHAVQISSWFDDANDRALLDLIPYFERLASHPNVVEFLRHNAPPTPHAAVGTVGLPIGGLPSIACVGELVGRSPDATAGVISNIRRPGMASPLPAYTQESRPSPRPVPVSVSEAHAAQVDLRRPRGAPAGPTTPRSISASTLPVITKLAAPSLGPSINPNRFSDTNITFPAPLSLATYIPVPSNSSAAITATSRLTGNVSQARTPPGPTTNSHNLPGTSSATNPHLRPSPSLTLSSTTSGSTSVVPVPLQCTTTTSDHNPTHSLPSRHRPHSPLVERPPTRHQTPPPNSPHCSSSTSNDENHSVTYSLSASPAKSSGKASQSLDSSVPR